MIRNKILLLYPYYWPYYKAGGPVQSLYNLVGHFQHDAEFYLVSKDRDIDGQYSNERLPLNRWTTGPQGEFVFYTSYISVFLLYRLMQEIQPEIVFINGLFYTDTSLQGLLAARLTNQTICISPRGMLQNWALARKPKRKKFFLSFIKLLLGKKILWHATDEIERHDICKHFGKQQSVHIALNVPRRISEFNTVDFPDANGRIKLVFLSLINPNKNLHLVIDAVNNASTEFTLDIYGPVSDPEYWLSCQQRIKAHSPIRYHGPVSAWNVTSTLRQYHFFILPTEGENFGHAIFDALSCSVPVIIPRTTPWKDLDQHLAGIYFDLDGQCSLTKVLNQTREFNGERYLAMRKGSFNYAQRYLKGRDFKAEYKFLIHSNGQSSH